MLVLTRRTGQELWLGDDIKIKLLHAEPGQARLGIEAPESVVIKRAEIEGEFRRSKRDTLKET